MKQLPKTAKPIQKVKVYCNDWDAARTNSLSAADRYKGIKSFYAIAATDKCVYDEQHGQHKMEACWLHNKQTRLTPEQLTYIDVNVIDRQAKKARQTSTPEDKKQAAIAQQQEAKQLEDELRKLSYSENTEVVAVVQGALKMLEHARTIDDRLSILYDAQHKIASMESFKYGREVELGKAFVRMLRGSYRVYIVDHISEDGRGSSMRPADNKSYTNYEDAKLVANALNDWQCLGLPGHKVYKGDATFSKAFDMQPWEHVYPHKGKLYFFVWDTRELTKVAKQPEVDIMPYLKPAVDNGNVICKNGKWLLMSELEAQPINFKTKKQAAMEDDMLVADSDNTSMAPDVDSVSSGDAQVELGNNKNVNYMKLKKAIRIGSVTIPAGTVLMFNKDDEATYKGVKVLKSAVESIESLDTIDAEDAASSDAIPKEPEPECIKVAMTYDKFCQKCADWINMGLDCGYRNDDKHARFALPTKIQQARQLMNILAELGYGFNDMVYNWPSLVDAAGGAEVAQRYLYARQIANSGYATNIDSFNNTARH